jgi:hypothetical protein
MASKMLYLDFAKTFDFHYADLQWLMIGMEDPSDKEKMVAPPPPSNKSMRQHDEAGPLV